MSVNNVDNSLLILEVILSLRENERDILELYLTCHLDEGDIAELLKTSRADVKSQIKFTMDLMLYELKKRGIHKETSNFSEDKDLMKAFDLYIKRKMKNPEPIPGNGDTNRLLTFSEQRNSLEKLESIVTKQYLHLCGKMISKAAICFFYFPALSGKRLCHVSDTTK